MSTHVKGPHDYWLQNHQRLARQFEIHQALLLTPCHMALALMKPVKEVSQLSILVDDSCIFPYLIMPNSEVVRQNRFQPTSYPGSLLKTLRLSFLSIDGQGFIHAPRNGVTKNCKKPTWEFNGILSSESQSAAQTRPIDNGMMRNSTSLTGKET